MPGNLRTGTPDRTKLAEADKPRWRVTGSDLFLLAFSRERGVLSGLRYRGRGITYKNHERRNTNNHHGRAAEGVCRPAEGQRHRAGTRLVGAPRRRVRIS